MVDLKFKGVYLHTPVDEKPLDEPEFLPLYDKMLQYDLPIVIHPMRKSDHPDFLTEKESKYSIFSLFGWPYDTTVAMARLVFSGIMEQHPGLKVVNASLWRNGAFLCGKNKTIYSAIRQQGQRKRVMAQKAGHRLFQDVLCGYSHLRQPFGTFSADMSFFGADHILFGVDFPLGDVEHGDRNYRQTINAIDQMNITEEERKKIYQDNAKALMHLPI